MEFGVQCAHQSVVQLPHDRKFERFNAYQSLLGINIVIVRLTIYVIIIIIVVHTKDLCIQYLFVFIVFFLNFLINPFVDTLAAATPSTVYRQQVE